MWADWLGNYIARTTSRHAIAPETFGRSDEAETIIQPQTGDPHSRRIKCVCGLCNNGWMSTLQKDTKPFLVPMLAGEPVDLRRNGQTALAAWTAMFVMVAEHLDLNTVAVPASDRRSLRSNARPPSHWRIWIGRQSTTSHPLFSHNVLSFVHKEEIERLGIEHHVPANTQTSAILLGEHLLIYVMSSLVARDIIRRWPLPAPVAGSLVQIWPIKNEVVRWPVPGGHVFNDLGVHGLAQHFFRAGRMFARETAARLR
jgi:hypothetical protein